MQSTQSAARSKIAIVAAAWGLLGATAVFAAQSPSQLPATGYFVDCDGGDDSLPGTSHSTPWRTLGKVNSTVKTPGADVWILAGTTCRSQMLNVDWAGNSEADPVIIGSYYVSDGVANQNRPTNPNTNPMDGLTYAMPRPTIQGSYIPSCRVWPSRCAFNTADPVNQTPGTAVPTSRYSALVEVIKPFVTVQDLVVRDSAGVGVQMDGRNNGTRRPCDSSVPAGLPPGGCDYYFTVRNVHVTHSAGNPIYILGVRYSVAYGNELDYGDLAWRDGQPASRNWGNLIDTGQCMPCYALIENSYLHDGWGEGIGPYGTSVILVRGNRVAGVRTASIYTSGGRHVIEQNIVAGGAVTQEAGLGDPNKAGVYGVSNLTFFRERGSTAGTGNAEETTRQLFRNNLVASYTACLQAGIGIDDPTQPYSLDGKFLGNTCVGAAGKNALSISNTGPEYVNARGVEYANNILASTTGAPTCDMYNGGPLTTEHHNYWVGTPAVRCRTPGTGDRYGTYAEIGFSSFDFATADKRDFPAYTDFMIPSTSGAATVGLSMTGVLLNQADWTWVLSKRTWLAGCQSTQVPIGEWVKALATDYCGAQRTRNSAGAFNAGGSTAASFNLDVD